MTIPTRNACRPVCVVAKQPERRETPTSWRGDAVISAGWAGRKLLGPLFDEIAEDWRQRYSEHRLRNLDRIGQKAQAKLGGSIDDEGEVPPRIAAVVMDSGSWCDADVMSEYFGGPARFTDLLARR